MTGSGPRAEIAPFASICGPDADYRFTSLLQVKYMSRPLISRLGKFA